MSHNSKYYTKKLTKRDARGLPKIKDVFQNWQKMTVSQTDSETPSEIVSEILSTVLDEICSPNKKSKLDDTVTLSPAPKKTSVSISQYETRVIDDFPVSIPSSDMSDDSSCCSSKTKDLEGSSSSPHTSSSMARVGFSAAAIVDQRKFYAAKYESQYNWLYFSFGKGGYLCKFCELFCPPSSLTDKPFVSKGVMRICHFDRELTNTELTKLVELFKGLKGRKMEL